MAIADEKYLLLTTFRKAGAPVSTAVWSADLGNGTAGLWTSSGSGKAKRLAHTSKVKIQPSDGRGKVRPGTQPIETTAKWETGAEIDLIREKSVAKYGFMTKITGLLGTIGGMIKRKRIPYGDCGVVITLPKA